MNYNHHYYHPMNNRVIDFPIEILMWWMIPLAVYQNLNVTCIYLLQIGMNHRYANRSQKMLLDCSETVVADLMSTMMMLYRCLLIVVMNSLVVEMNSQSSLRIGSMKVQAYYKANTIEFSLRRLNLIIVGFSIYQCVRCVVRFVLPIESEKEVHNDVRGAFDVFVLFIFHFFWSPLEGKGIGVKGKLYIEVSLL